MRLFAAPVQGYTEALWRNLHEELFGGVEAYYTPFIRLEKEQLRSKDLREINPSNNSVQHLVPQVIANTPQELSSLIQILEEKGYGEIDINLGCPFPPIALKHRGAGLLPYPDEVKSLFAVLSNYYPHIRFSVKMRLGMSDKNEWREILPILNDTPLEHITLHPRIGKQQYTGEVDKEAFQEFLGACKHPVIYNGDVQTLDDIQQIATQVPTIKGIMLGRGLLAHPFLSAEYKEQRVWDEEERVKAYKEFHKRLFHEMSAWLTGGEAQVLSKIKPYWEYLYPEMEKREKKAILKANTLEKYMSAVNTL